MRDLRSIGAVAARRRRARDAGARPGDRHLDPRGPAPVEPHRGRRRGARRAPLRDRRLRPGRRSGRGLRPRADRWERRAPLPVSLHHAAAVAVGGRLYVVGGYAGGQWAVLDSVFEYDPGTDRWRARAPLPTARGALAAAVIDGRIYAAGGVGAGAAQHGRARGLRPRRGSLGAAGADAGAPRPPRGGRRRGEAPRRRGAPRRELRAEPRRPSRVRPGDQQLGGPAALADRPERDRRRRPGVAPLRVRRRGAGGDLRSGRGLRRRPGPMERAGADADAASRSGGHRPGGADPRRLGRPPARWVVQLRPRGAEPPTASSVEQRRARRL